jgi:hypothetical protein
MNRHVMPSLKHQQERSITNRSGQQHPGEIAAGGPATPEGLPGANTQGRTLDEARENLKEAVEMIIEANRKLTRIEITGSGAIIEELLVAA